MAQAHQVPVLDLLPALREAAERGQRLYFPVDIHWTPAGHELAARAVADLVLRSGLLR
jgi:hypothetical protein